MAPTLIFDLDGTLVDTAPDLLHAANAVLSARGRPPIDPATLHHMVGFGAKSLITQAFAATGGVPAPEDMPALVELFLAHYGEHMADHSRPFPGVAATLQGLAHKGALMGVLTNKPHDLAGPLLEKLDLARFFAAIYGAGFKPYVKPDRRIFDDVVVACGGDPGHAVMIGDSVTDLHTARAAAAPCILMSYGYTPVPASSLGADLVLDEFTQLPQALGRLRPAWFGDF
ncbi:MAG TPA: HAD-IA family hydrolase [Rhizomicrobium sp.]|nr:HAD-IA family hydrolase [Rhizomicrobium sp.]